MPQVLSKWRAVLAKFAAELAIIVLGVTIALWADSWVGRRSDQAEEAARLYALHDNLQESLAHVRAALNGASEAADALRWLVSPERRNQDGGSPAQLLRTALLFGPSFYPELNVYDDLKNSGELGLLTNSELRRLLATMDARLELVRLAQTDLLTVQQLNVDPYMIRRIDLSTFYGDVLNLDDPTEDSELDHRLLSERDFRNLALLKLDLVTQLDLQLQQTETAFTAVQRSIASQLGIQSQPDTAH